MPLTPAKLRVEVTNPHYVRVQMEDGDKSITVHIAAGWLKELAKRDRRTSDNMLLLYSLYREQIEAAASAKYDRLRPTSADVVVIADDLI